MKLSEAFPSNYLKSEDLQDRDVSVIIESAQMETLRDERKLILTFQGKKKSMVCNKTNAGRISFMYGDDTDEWVGREIVLTAEIVEYKGKAVKGLRVKPPVKRTPAPAKPGNGNNFTDRPISGGGRIMDTSPPVHHASNHTDEEIPF